MNVDNSHITLYLTDLPTHILINISLLSNNFNIFLTCKLLYNRTIQTTFRVNYLALKYPTIAKLYSPKALSSPWLNKYNTLSKLIDYTGYDIEIDSFQLIKLGLKLRKLAWFPHILEKFELYRGEDKQAIKNEFLVEACSGRHIELIELILRLGGDPSHNQCNLIFSSILDNDYNLAKLLLSYSPPLDELIVNHLLRGCANIESLEIIDILLDRGADINSENGYLIRQQCYLGNFRVVNYLLGKGANPTLMNHATLLSACQRGHAQLIQPLVKSGCNPNFNNGMPLFFSTNYNKLDVIRELVRLGANPSLNNIGFECLVIACKKGSLPVVKYFVESLNISINPEHPEKERSPIIWAIIHKHRDIVEYLITMGADLNNPYNCCLYYAKKSKQNAMSELIEGRGGILINN